MVQLCVKSFPESFVKIQLDLAEIYSLCVSVPYMYLYLYLRYTFAFVQGVRRAPIWWRKATSPPQELEGGVHSTPNFKITSQGARRAPIWWRKATSPPQELEAWPP